MSALSVTCSILGQPWRWRSLAGEADCAATDLTDQLLMSRGVTRDALAVHREPTIRGFMPDPSIFRDMDVAAERLAKAVVERQSVTIFGDYDVDGATSSALLIRLLRALELNPGSYIPDRLLEGYGPSGDALAGIAAGGADLIVTVDCGAQAFDALARAAETGVDVIVVDHHKCTAELPRALALVNPNRLDEEEGAAHGHLAAVGVAFLLGAALLRTLRRRGWFESRPEPSLMELLDLVALGTVADVAALRGLNRAFVSQGLKIMRKGRNIGLAALARAAGLTKPPTATDLGFALGPRINAGGRVGKSDLGVRLLVTEDEGEADEIAAELDRLNGERRAIEQMVTEAAEQIAATQGNRAVAVVAGEGWHPGVIGIVAGRLKERLGRPTIVIALDGETGKGSGRSIAGVDLGAAVLAARDSGLLVAGGGHAMAAGLTIDAAAVDALATFLDDRLAADVARARDDRALLFDAVVSARGVAGTLVDALDAAGPYGAGWPAPRVATGPVRIIKADIVGNGHVRAIVAGDDGGSIKTIAFRQATSPLGLALLGAGPHRRLWLAGRARRDDWSGGDKAELHIDDAAWAD
ncbi:single-stranded-DNA-specific exonuclease RecJ [Sphingomonas sp.]|uniref:single-stranded-DNA-specific exonuclease RecJ n=1 Tax=Sphingomonas sp. TaxID=28214 RepID=UPI000DAFF37E|nr:single-stranded-DNA-specific exonuclease RecJ [Sphingomonas sp.]PZU11627.1 MAG: single-stranded-DNA-specific exonuclease RecJ [Sphingomonas sp.]